MFAVLNNMGRKGLSELSRDLKKVREPWREEG